MPAAAKVAVVWLALLVPFTLKVAWAGPLISDQV